MAKVSIKGRAGKLEATTCKWEECQKEFTYVFVRDEREFCSKSCSTAYRHRYGKKQTKYKEKTGATVVCENKLCGKEFYVNLSKLEEKRFCSKACYDIYQSQRVLTNCQYCDKEVLRPPSQSHYRYCSRFCMGLDKIANPIPGRWHNGKPAKKDDKGYVMLWEPDHPNKSMKGWQYEHRLVAEEKLGRYLTSEEDVHHVNEIKDDNDPNNLEVMDGIAHAILSSRNYHKEVKRMEEELAAYKAKYGNLE